MTGIIYDLNTFLKHTSDLTQNVEETEMRFVQELYKTKPADYIKKISELATKLNLINNEAGKVNLKDSGKIFFEKITKKDGKIYLDSNVEQIDFLKEKFLSGEQFPDEFRNMLEEFWTVSKQSMLICRLKTKHKFDKFVLAYLEEIGIFERRRINDITELRLTNNLESISKIKHNTKEVSEEELIKKLEENRLIGKKAEQYAIEYEKKRLVEEEGRIDLSMDIKQVSLTDSHAGFDLKSYEGKNSELTKHDRKIEVKGTTSNSPRFYWSSNEVKKAEECGESYWIYLYTNIKSENKKLNKIKNPFKKFFEDSDTEPICTGYFLDNKIIGL